MNACVYSSDDRVPVMTWPFSSLIEYSPGPASLDSCYLMRTLEHNLKMSAKMTFSLGLFQKQRKVEPKLDRVVLEYSFGISIFFPRSSESWIQNQEKQSKANHGDELDTVFILLM